MTKNILIAVTVLITALSILSNNCNGNKDVKAGTLEEKIFPLVFEKENEKPIHMIAKGGPIFARINDPDHIYIYFLQNQDRNCEVLKLSNELEIKERYVVSRGAGPGEARNPRIYGGDHRSVIVYDAPARKYIEFEPNFKLIDEYRAKNQGTFLYSGGKYIPGKRIIIDGFKKMESLSRKSDGSLFLENYIRVFARKFSPGKKTIDDTKLFETGFDEHWKDNKTPLFNVINFVYAFDHVYILDKREYRVIKMDIDGNVLKEKKFAFQSKTFPGSDREKWVEKFFGKEKVKDFDFPAQLFPASWLMPIANGIAVGQCENYDLDDKGPVSADYFDPDLNYLGKITIPYFWAWNQPHHGQNEVYNRFLYRKEKLYHIQWKEDDYKIVVWKVRIEKN
jgi:hypothetical protein